MKFLLPEKILLLVLLSLLITTADAGEGNQAVAEYHSDRFIRHLSEHEIKWLKTHPVVTVAIDPGWPPVEFINERGEPSGMSQDYLNIVEQKLGIKFKRIQNMSWQEMYSLLKRGEIDMTTSVAETPERKQLWSFTRPYMKMPIVIATLTDIPYIADMKELSGRDVAIVEGYAVEDWIKSGYPEIQLVRVRTALDGLQLLQSGKVYAYIDNLLIIGDYQAKMKITNIKIAGQTPYVNAQCMAVRKDWPVLTGIIQKALDSISEKEQQDIYRKWLPVRYEYGFNYKLFWQVTAGFLLALGVLIFWNRKLAMEIKSRKHTEKMLKEKDERIHSIGSNIQTGMIYQAVIQEDGSRKFTYLSDSVRNLYGISPEEGMAYPGLIYSKIHDDDIKRLAEEEEEAIKTFSTFKTEVRVYSPSGNIRWSSFVSVPRLLENGLTCFDGIEFDITGLKKSEEKIQQLLAEKELILREVHHRIKNNMNTIKGLLTLQISSEENPAAAASLASAESRVQSMIMLYDRLYCTENYRELSIRDYLTSLTEEIISSSPNREIVKIITEIEDFILNINILTPLGIIVNEILTDMMKFAFEGKDSGVINLSASLNENHVSIEIRDNGIGIPESVTSGKGAGFGLELVGMLTEQMGGSVRIERLEGTKFTLEFDI